MPRAESSESWLALFIGDSPLIVYPRREVLLLVIGVCWPLRLGLGKGLGREEENI